MPFRTSLKVLCAVSIQVTASRTAAVYDIKIPLTLDCMGTRFLALKMPLMCNNTGVPTASRFYSSIGVSNGAHGRAQRLLTVISKLSQQICRLV